ncbi:MAG: ImmA/IrrE family metallo-endopeptidase [Bacteroidota bacterium]
MENGSSADDKFTIDALLKQSWQYKGSAQFYKFFDFIAKFHHYSHFNSMMVYLQNPDITFFGSKSFWKNKFGRGIKQDDDVRAYVILAPMGPIMVVYDVMDTTGKDSPEEFLKNGLGNEPFQVTGLINPQIVTNVIDEAVKWGIKIKTKPFSYFKGGHITTLHKGYLEICLKKDMKPEENFSVLIHELAHLFLGHTGHKQISKKNSKTPMKLLERKLTFTAEELEAEAVSYLICRKLGLFTNSAQYMAGYIKKEDDLIKFSYETVIKVADKIESMFIKNTPRSIPNLFSQPSISDDIFEK